MRVVLLISMLWALGASLWQLRGAHGGGRRDYSQRVGDPLRGILYSFTAAMLPTHKETVRLHPGKFAIGMLMHIGVFVSLLALLGSLVAPEMGSRAFHLIRPLNGLALIAALYLLIRRASSETMRAMSSPEDYLAILATAGFLLLSLLWSAHEFVPRAGWLYMTLLFVYLPLGKLRHAVFFFAARGDYGRRLGYRGVYPPARP